jgi:hypothetical protein
VILGNILFSAGLTNLQGEIDKETQKLKNEGTKEVSKIAAAGRHIFQSCVRILVINKDCYN